MKIHPELEAWSATIVDARAWAVSYVSIVSNDRRLPTTVVHADLFPGNVLVADDELVGIIDWEKAQTD